MFFCSLKSEPFIEVKVKMMHNFTTGEVCFLFFLYVLQWTFFFTERKSLGLFRNLKKQLHFPLSTLCGLNNQL